MHPAIRVNRPYPSSKVWANPIHAIPVSRLIVLALLFRYGRRNAGPPHLQTNPCRGTRASISKDIRSMSLFRPNMAVGVGPHARLDVNSLSYQTGKLGA